MKRFLHWLGHVVLGVESGCRLVQTREGVEFHCKKCDRNVTDDFCEVI